MPTKPSWILELPRIRKVLESLETPVIDRAGVEEIFGVRRRRAVQLMHKFGGYQAGRTFLVERGKLLQAVCRIETGEYDWELGRRKRLVAEIERAKQLLPGRQVRLVAPADVVERRMADLSAGVHLQPGELRIEFNGAEDLLRQMFELSQAIMNDYRRFEEIVGSAIG